MGSLILAHSALPHISGTMNVMPVAVVDKRVFHLARGRIMSEYTADLIFRHIFDRAFFRPVIVVVVLGSSSGSKDLNPGSL